MGIGQIKFWDKQGGTSVQTLVILHPDLLSSVFRRSQKYICAVSLEPAVTKFASRVHLTWCEKYWQNSNKTTRNGGAICRWGR